MSGNMLRHLEIKPRSFFLRTACLALSSIFYPPSSILYHPSSILAKLPIDDAIVPLYGLDHHFTMTQFPPVAEQLAVIRRGVEKIVPENELAARLEQSRSTGKPLRIKY